MDPEKATRLPYPSQGDHLTIIESNMALADAQRQKHSLKFRRRLLADLDLGIEMMPIKDKKQVFFDPDDTIDQVFCASYLALLEFALGLLSCISNQNITTHCLFYSSNLQLSCISVLKNSSQNI